jgi:hypothetical protein
MDWKVAGVTAEGQSFELGGLNVWSHDWISLKQPTLYLPHPFYPQQTHSMLQYQIKSGDVTVTFAAGELSANVWGFYVPA